MTKPFRTFPVLQRLTVDDFDLTKNPNDDPTKIDGTAPTVWFLELGGQVIFRLPAILDLGEAEARNLFQWMLDHRANSVFIGYDEGKKSIQRELRSLLAVPALYPGDD